MPQRPPHGPAVRRRGCCRQAASRWQWWADVCVPMWAGGRALSRARAVGMPAVGPMCPLPSGEWSEELAAVAGLATAHRPQAQTATGCGASSDGAAPRQRAWSPCNALERRRVLVSATYVLAAYHCPACVPVCSLPGAIRTVGFHCAVGLG